ncbi:unnamed protein product [Somion occarium]|uniref:ABM domain-containing protein n=1 Tax=Somion occarium TaxID=3059160 RepID=A0ABP1DMF7_9APHY
MKLGYSETTSTYRCCTACFPITVTDAYKADPNIVQEAVEFLKNANGTKRIFYGLGVQDPTIWWLLIEWETLKHHQDLKRQRAIPDSETEDPQVQFRAPYAELALWTLKSGHTTKEKKEHALELLKGVVTTLNGLPSDSGVFKGTVGPIVEEAENGVALTLGWTSPDKALETLPEAQVIIDELKEIADLRLVHVPLTSAK